MDDTTYVRDKLAEARGRRGMLAQIARETQTDQRTMRSLMTGARMPNFGTVEKLASYFKREDRKAAKL